MPNDLELRREILEETHKSDFTIHPGSSKIYQDLKKNFWRAGIKKDIVEFMPRCVLCQQVKIEHKRLGGILQPLEIPEWKWESIFIDFI